MATFDLVGGPHTFQDAVAAKMGQGNWLEVGPSSDKERHLEHVSIVYCSDQDAWEVALKRVVDCPVMCVITRLDPFLYQRALRRGCGVAWSDGSTEVITLAAQATARHEVLMPRIVAQVLADSADLRSTGQQHFEIDDFEEKLLVGYANRLSWRELADELGYSQRTLQRRLQHLKLKAGVRTRAELREWLDAHA